jgi:hypothetical protein
VLLCHLVAPPATKLLLLLLRPTLFAAAVTAVAAPCLQLAKGPVRVGVVSGNAITIKDAPPPAAAAAAGGGSAANGAPADAAMTADEDYARRLQAKMDAQAMGGAK